MKSKKIYEKAAIKIYNIEPCNLMAGSSKESQETNGSAEGTGNESLYQNNNDDNTQSQILSDTTGYKLIW